MPVACSSDSVESGDLELQMWIPKSKDLKKSHDLNTIACHLCQQFTNLEFLIRELN